MPTLQPYEEKELLLRIADGDQAAFSRLFDQYWSSVFVIVLKYLKRAAPSEDATQEIFFTVWINRLKLPQVLHFESYLRAMTRNYTISVLRKNALQLAQYPPDEFHEPLLPADHQSPEQQLSFKETSELINKAIQLLPPRRKEVFLLSRVQGMSHAEIAAKLGISKLTVSEHITEALVFLRSWLAGHANLYLTASTLISILLKK